MFSRFHARGNFPKNEFEEPPDDVCGAAVLVLVLDRDGKWKIDGRARLVARKPPLGARKPPVAMARRVEFEVVVVLCNAPMVKVDTEVAVTVWVSVLIRVDVDVTVDGEGQVVETEVTVIAAGQVVVADEAAATLIMLASTEPAVAVVVVAVARVKDGEKNVEAAATVAVEVFVVDVAKASKLLVDSVVVVFA